MSGRMVQPPAPVKSGCIAKLASANVLWNVTGMNTCTVAVASLMIFTGSGAIASDIPVPVPTPRPVDVPQPQSSGTLCHSKLKAIRLSFKPLPPVSDPKGCSIADPVEISTLPDGSVLTPPAQLSCETAYVLTLFLRDIAQQQAISILGSTIGTFRQDSAYVCRPRNGTTKLSEHAYGRAIDIGAFVTRSGDTLGVKAADGTDKRHDAYLSAVRLAACGPFTTVLGPGSDADHALHFHFDLAPRRGNPFCQ